MKPFIIALAAALSLSLVIQSHASKTLSSAAAERPEVERVAAEVERPARATGQRTLKTTQTYESKKQARLDELYKTGVALYGQGDLRGAHEVFEEMLLIDPNNAAATTFLDNMKDEWDAFLEQELEMNKQLLAEEQGEELLRRPVTIETLRPTPLDQFLNNLSFATGMNFAIASGVTAEISNAKFIDSPLQDVLDAVLLPIGLRWKREAGVVIVEPALETQVFHLSRQDMARVAAIYNDGTLQRIVWGPDGKPDLEGEVMLLDERQMALIATDSRQRLDKIAALMTDLTTTINPGLVTRIYKIRAQAGPEIRALIDAVITTAPATPLDLDRRVYVDGEDLIIRETPERLIKIEELLADEGFMQKLVSDELDIQAFSLIPRTALEENREYMQAFAERVVEQVRTFLYTRIGLEEAQALGRHMWFDPNTLTLVLADTPENIRDVSSFLDSLPELEAQQRFSVIYLRYALASDLQSELANLLGLEGAGDADDGGLMVEETMRREDEFTWRDLTIVVRRINAGGDDSDEFDDSAEIIVRVASSRQSTNFTLNELDVSQYVTDAEGGEYEIYADDIKPTGTSGDGRVKLVIRYSPPLEALQGP